MRAPLPLEISITAPRDGRDRRAPASNPASGVVVPRAAQGRSTNNSADRVATDSAVDRNTAEATVAWQTL